MAYSTIVEIIRIILVVVFAGMGIGFFFLAILNHLNNRKITILNYQTESVVGQVRVPLIIAFICFLFVALAILVF